MASAEMIAGGAAQEPLRCLRFLRLDARKESIRGPRLSDAPLFR